MPSVIDDYEYIAKRWREITETAKPADPFEDDLEEELEMLGYMSDCS